VITGAASGIGLALARAVAARGMNVVLADHHEQRLAEAVTGLGAGSAAWGVVADVTDPESVAALAEAAADRFGPVHLLANNAGVLRPGTTHECPTEDWRAVFAVNVDGIVNGQRSFVPRMLAHGEPARVLNTASLGGLIAAPAMAPYIVSKHAAVAISESLAIDLAGTNVGVTVLCPGGVATDIYRAERERRAAGGVDGGGATEEVFARVADAGRTDQADPDDVAAVAIEAIERGDLYALTFGAEQRAAVRARLATIEAALRTCEQRAPDPRDEP